MLFNKKKVDMDKFEKAWKVIMVILILGAIYYLFFTVFPTVEGYDIQINTSNSDSDVQITSSNGATQTIYDTSFVDLFFTTDSSSNGTSTTTTPQIPSNYFSDNGNKCVLSGNTIVVTTAQGVTTNYVSSTTTSAITDQVFYDNMGGYSKIFSDGVHYFVEVQPYNAPLFVLTSNPPASTPPPPTTSPYMQGGIPYSMIPPGNEDLYILKSEIVPPVCPKCPDYNASGSSTNAKCPPCPACARCPEPSFECKKVPNYQSINSNTLPSPILNDFSTFGM